VVYSKLITHIADTVKAEIQVLFGDHRPVFSLFFRVNGGIKCFILFCLVFVVVFVIDERFL